MGVTHCLNTYKTTRTEFPPVKGGGKKYNEAVCNLHAASVAINNIVAKIPQLTGGKGRTENEMVCGKHATSSIWQEGEGRN